MTEVIATQLGTESAWHNRNRGVALVADALVNKGGAEKVFSVMCEAFPGATIFTSVYLPELTLEEFRSYSIVELADRRLFGSERRLKLGFPLAALQITSADFSDFRVVLTSSAHLARYINAGSATHISYCYYPFRLLFEPHRYSEIRGAPRAMLLAALPILRRWDVRQARKVNHFIAISEASRSAIKRYYGREADIISPPLLNVPETFEAPAKDDYFLVVSRLERWKMLDVVVDAFNRCGKPLVVVGTGSDEVRLRRLARRNVIFAGSASEAELARYYARARAVVQLAPTEYGLTPLEANAYGTPAICYGVGGVVETMVPHGVDPVRATALFFCDSSSQGLVEALRAFERISFDPRQCYENAVRYGKEVFVRKISGYVRDHVA